MPKKNLPNGWTSWIQFHDYLKKEKPELFKYKTIRFMQYQPIGKPVETYSISIAALERNCWKEIEKFRLDINSTYDAITRIIHSSADIDDKSNVINFLKKSQRNI